MSHRIVLDTNLIVSALLNKNSVPRQAFDKAFEHGIVLFSKPCLKELNEVLQRPKFEKYITHLERNLFLETFIQHVHFVMITHQVNDCRDANDNKYLELGLSGYATHIITGDQDLLTLHPYEHMLIITPREYVDNQETIEKGL